MLVGGGNDPGFGFNEVSATESIVLTLCENTQQSSLQPQWHVPNFIKKQRPIGRLLKPADALFIGACKCTAFVTK